MSKAEYSVVIPFFNEEENLQVLHGDVVSVLSKLNIKSEIIYVDDGSSDKSLAVLEDLINRDAALGEKVAVKLIKLRKNFGQTAAISAGIDNSSGRLISFLDADLQNDPKDLPKFLEKIRGGYDAVFGWRKDRHDATIRSLLSKIANIIIKNVFSYPYHDVGCSARVVKKEYLEGIQLYGELHRIMPVLIYLKGANIAEIVVTHRDREKGISKYGFSRIIKTIIDIITVKFLTTYGTKPAYVFGTLGLGSILLSVISLVAVVYRKLFLSVYVHRDPIFLISILFVIVGIQFILMGLIAELQVRTYFESQHKPIYEVKRK